MSQAGVPLHSESTVPGTLLPRPARMLLAAVPTAVSFPRTNILTGPPFLRLTLHSRSFVGDLPRQHGLRSARYPFPFLEEQWGRLGEMMGDQHCEHDEKQRRQGPRCAGKVDIALLVEFDDGDET